MPLWRNISLLPGRLVGTGCGVAVSTGGLRGVDSLTGVGHLSHEAVCVVSCVGGGLDTAVGEGDGERAGNIATGILGLSLLEVGLAVIISHTVLVGVGLGGQLLLNVGSRGAVGRWAGRGCQGGSEEGRR